MPHFLTLLQIIVFFTREISQKGPKNDIGQLNQGVILDNSNLTLFIFTNDFFFINYTFHFD
jgi:hypothetical protein